MSMYECNCARCNGDGPPDPPEHREDCCCEDCHENVHIAIEYMDICEACAEQVREAEKEAQSGNGQQQEG